MNLDLVKTKVSENEFLISDHADKEAAEEDIDIIEIRSAILAGEYLEEYEDTGRGESCLILGFVEQRPIHVVCGWRNNKVVVITMYEPKPPKFADPRTRG